MAKLKMDMFWNVDLIFENQRIISLFFFLCASQKFSCEISSANKMVAKQIGDEKKVLKNYLVGKYAIGRQGILDLLTIFYHIHGTRCSA